MSERLYMGKAEENDARLEASKEEAREKIVKTIEKFRDEPNLVINIEEESPETMILGIKVIDPENKESKTYRKGFMKVLKLPNGLTIEEAVENEIRFPERSIEGA